jgi:hypothetical protein
LWQEINERGRFCHWWRESHERIVSAMNAHVMSLLFLLLLFVSALAVVVATVREVRRDRRPIPAAWPDWRDQHPWRNVRVT